MHMYLRYATKWAGDSSLLPLISATVIRAVMLQGLRRDDDGVFFFIEVQVGKGSQPLMYPRITLSVYDSSYR